MVYKKRYTDIEILSDQFYRDDTAYGSNMRLKSSTAFLFPLHEPPSQETDYYVLFLRIQQIFCHKIIGIMLDLSYIFFGYTFSLSLSLSLSLSHSKIKLSIEFEWNLVSNRVIKPMRLSVKVLLC